MRIAYSLVLTGFAAFLAACGGPERTEVATDDEPATAAEAERIAVESLIVDTHIDLPYRLKSNPADITVRVADGDFDYERAAEGRLNAAFMSIYTPAELEAEGQSFAAAEGLIDMVEDIAARAPDKFALAYSVADVREQFDDGLISLPLGLENGSPLEGSFDNLRHFYDRGVRYITLAHSLSNHISDSSYDDNRQWQGLSDFGKSLVPEMNRLGIMVDVSHLSDDAFWQVLDISAVPVIASHSSARHFTPEFERNMSDEMIVELAENGGVIMINYGSSFITAEAREYSDKRRAALARAREANPDLSVTDLIANHRPAFEAEHGPFPYATLDDVLDHFDHVVALAGVDAVGIGSDYDGVGDSLPTGLKDAASYPDLVRGLLERGYSETDIRKILGENLLRVWADVEAYAAEEAGPQPPVR